MPRQLSTGMLQRLLVLLHVPFSVLCQSTGMLQRLLVLLHVPFYANIQGRIKAGADGAAAPGPQPKIGPPLF